MRWKITSVCEGQRAPHFVGYVDAESYAGARKKALTTYDMLPDELILAPADEEDLDIE